MLKSAAAPTVAPTPPPINAPVSFKISCPRCALGLEVGVFRIPGVNSVFEIVGLLVGPLVGRFVGEAVGGVVISSMFTPNSICRCSEVSLIQELRKNKSKLYLLHLSFGQILTRCRINYGLMGEMFLLPSLPLLVNFLLDNQRTDCCRNR
jgi:hypothetical protein